MRITRSSSLLPALLSGSGINFGDELNVGEDFLEQINEEEQDVLEKYSKGEFVNKIIAKGRHGSLIVESMNKKTKRLVAVKIISKKHMNY